MRESAKKQTLQIQIKSRVSDAGGDIVYQILFPKERKGESVFASPIRTQIQWDIVHAAGNLKPIGSAEMKQSLVGSDLSYEDIIDSPFAWSQQASVGRKTWTGHSLPDSGIETGQRPHLVLLQW